MRVHPCSLTPRLMSVAVRMFTIPIIHSKYGIASYAADSSNYTVPLIEGGLFRFRTYCCLHERKKAVSHVFFIYFGANCLKAQSQAYDIYIGSRFGKKCTYLPFFQVESLIDGNFIDVLMKTLFTPATNSGPRLEF